MQKKRYECDGGSIAIGTPGCQANFVNRYGDGLFTVYVVDRQELNNFRNFTRTDLDFRGSVEGDSINIYSYDCLTSEGRKNKHNILFTLSGRYGVYALQNGDMVLERWD